MDPMLQVIQTRLLRIEQKYHNPNFSTLVQRMLTACAERELLPVPTPGR